MGSKIMTKHGSSQKAPATPGDTFHSDQCRYKQVPVASRADFVDFLGMCHWQAVNAERSCNTDLAQLKEELRQAQDERSQANHDLENIRDLCVKLDTGKDSVCTVKVSMLTQILT